MTTTPSAGPRRIVEPAARGAVGTGMHSRARRTAFRGRAVRAALAVVLGLLGVAAGASPASAHAVLVSTSPAQDALLQEAPNQVVLTFTESVNPVAGKVQVIGPDGSRVDRDEARSSGEQLIIPLREITQRGTYLVTFRVISADSHPIGGAYSFSYLEVSPGGPPSAQAATGGSGAVLAALPVARWTGYVGLMLLVGAALVLALLWPRRLDGSGPLRLGYLGAGILALGTIAELALQVPYIAGTFSDVTGADVREALSSQFGAAHLVRLGVIGAAVVLLRAVARRRDWAADRVLLAVLGVIGVATWSISGHPSATDVPTVSVAADLVHLGSMSIWLGGLVMLVLFLLPRANAAELGAIVPVWSRWAGYAIGALLLTGLAQSLLQVGTLDAVYTTSYGLLLLAKVGLVAVVLVVASFSRRTVAAFVPEPEPAATGKLRRFVLAEALLAVVVIGVTSVLVQVTPARTEVDSVTEQPGVQTAILTDPNGRVVLTVDMTPGRVGINELHLYATTPDGRPRTIAEWTVRAANAGAGVDGIEAVILSITDDHAIGQVTLPTDGSWRFTFTLRLDETTNAIVAADFAVRGR